MGQCLQGGAGVFTNLDPGVGLAKARRWHGELGELQHGGRPGQKRQGQQEATGRGGLSVILRSTPLPRVCHPCHLSTDTGRAWDFSNPMETRTPVLWGASLETIVSGTTSSLSKSISESNTYTQASPEHPHACPQADMAPQPYPEYWCPMEMPPDHHPWACHGAAQGPGFPRHSPLPSCSLHTESDFTAFCSFINRIRNRKMNMLTCSPSPTEPEPGLIPAGSTQG